jgi:mono/diheme cytochrome c family protein
MSGPKSDLMIVVSLLLVLVGSTVPAARTDHTDEPTPGVTKAVINRGRYLVEGVAVCGRCHTPIDETGRPDRTKWLMGASVQIRPSGPAPEWAVVAPRLAGLPPGIDAEFVTLLTTGISRNGGQPRPPMPRFQMTRADAAAVPAYLKSLVSDQAGLVR